MASNRRGSWAPVIRPLVIVVLAVIGAVIGREGIWLAVAVVIGVLAATFAVIEIWNRIPVRRKDE
jgi:hypothetical protein